MLAMMSATAITCFTKIFSVSFLGYSRNKEATIDTVKSNAENISFLRLILLMIALSIFPGIIQNWLIGAFHLHIPHSFPLVLMIGETSYIPLLFMVLVG